MQLKELKEAIAPYGVSEAQVEGYLSVNGLTADHIDESMIAGIAKELTAGAVTLASKGKVAIAPVQSTQMARAGRKSRKTQTGDRGSIAQVSQQVEQYEQSVLGGIAAYADDKSSMIAQAIADLPAVIVDQVNEKVAGVETDPDQFRNAATDTLSRIGIQF